MIIDSTWNPGIPGVAVEDVVEVDIISVLVEDCGSRIQPYVNFCDRCGTSLR
jgi:uncharacterized OB-fold protein